ncbi:phosphoribosylanthranilate isomerase [Streptomyces sp. bgisy100]|uniref:phosphoribosylanthranilate isomerase n=1 Tax=Streptomyces sp. bgisy100 TaxID=3413783 RepID=UPI003D7250FC
MLLKVCGLVTDHELRRLSKFPVEQVGLWHGVPGGRSELPLERLVPLAARAVQLHLDPVLVTLEEDPEALRAAVAASGVRRVQLHGYPMPGTVRRIRAALPGVHLVKVLHARDGKVLEEPLIGAYEQAGADSFLFDSVGPDGRIGSTGRPLDPAALTGALERVGRPFLLAGGLSEEGVERYDRVLRHPGMLGIDLDSALRGPGGSLTLRRVDAIRTAWWQRLGRVRDEVTA